MNLITKKIAIIKNKMKTLAQNKGTKLDSFTNKVLTLSLAASGVADMEAESSLNTTNELELNAPKVEAAPINVTVEKKKMTPLVETIDIIDNFYDQRAIKSPKLKRRIYGNATERGEKDMALEWERFMDFTSRNPNAEVPNEIKTGGIFNGCKIDFSSCKSYHLGCVFESGMKPGIMDNKNRYIGLFQMDLGATVTGFLKKNKAKYPKLASLGQDVAARKVKNGEFQKEWKRLEATEAFRDDVNQYMEEHKYKKVFAELEQIEGLDIHNRGDVLASAIKSAANQYSNRVVVEMVKNAYDEAYKAAEANTINLISQQEMESIAMVPLEAWENSTMMADKLKIKSIAEESSLALALADLKELPQKAAKAKSETVKKAKAKKPGNKKRPLAKKTTDFSKFLRSGRD